jgi:hypothetical protein
MRKELELSTPTSCLNRARSDELVFVLLGRDICAAETIRYWAMKRVLLRKNSEHDSQIVEAIALADQMDAERGK